MSGAHHRVYYIRGSMSTFLSGFAGSGRGFSVSGVSKRDVRLPPSPPLLYPPGALVGSFDIRG